MPSRRLTCFDAGPLPHAPQQPQRLGKVFRDAEFVQTVSIHVHDESLDGTVRCAADDSRESGLRNLCHFITRPTVSGDCVRCIAAGQGVLHIGTLPCEVATKLGSSTLKFLRRQAALW